MTHKSLRQRIFHYATVAIIATYIFNIVLVFKMTKHSNYYSHPHKTNDISCYVTEDKSIPEIKEEMFSRKNIFFVETSCRGNLDVRQACAIESAARAHINRSIHVIFAGPVKEDALRSFPISPLLSFENINIARIYLSKSLKNTPLEDIIKKNLLKRSIHRVSHASDVLRFFLLWKYSGIYLDTDVIVLKSFDGLSPDFAGMENPYSIAAGIVGMSDSQIGRIMADQAVRELGKHFEPYVWAGNGPYLVTRLLQKICKTNKLHLMNAERCDGFEVYGPKVLYPVLFQKWRNLFKVRNVNLNNSYTVHAWNKYTYFIKIASNSVYSKLMMKYCPTIYSYFNKPNS